MRGILRVVILGSAACVASAGWLAFADPLADAGMTAEQIKAQLVESIGQGRPSLPYGLRKLGAEARADFVRAAGTIALDYYKTDDFRTRYAAWREEHAPKLAQLTEEQVKDRNDRAQADYAKATTEQKNMVASLEGQRADFKKAGLSDAQVDQMIAQTKQALQQMATLQANGTIPSGPQLMTEAQRQQENAGHERDYQTAKAKFDEEHPSDPSGLVRRKLEEFLKVSESVDFDAKVENGRFIDPANEHQSDEWKRCFRAGKQAVDAARAIAREWLEAV